MNKIIIEFLQNQSCANICCVDEEGNPCSFSCFYAFNKEEVLLYYKSSATSNHSLSILKNPVVAGTILPDKLQKLFVKGIQFKGVVLNAMQTAIGKASLMYHKKHPLALAISGDIWIVQIDYIKMTDSSVRFGEKLIWERKNSIQNNYQQSPFDLINS